MKPRWIGLLVVGLLFGTTLWWFSSRKSVEIEPVPKTPRATYSAKKQPKVPVITKSSTDQEPPVPIWEKSKDKWKTPIRFYGKVVDENGQPVDGAEAHFSWTDLSPEGTSQAVAYSDTQGLFLLEGVRGYHMTVDILKDSYYTSKEKNRTSFQYTKGDRFYHEPDSNNPVVFHLKKKGEAEPLIKRYSQISLPRDGSAVSFDLVGGKQSQVGQLGLQAWCSEKDAEGRYDWKLIIRVPDGGITSANEEFAFSAPESGYAPSLEINMPKNLGKDWKSSVEQQAYLVFGKPPRYARMNFRMSGIGENFYMDYWLNPSGSRNLEYDPQKEISVQRIAEVGLEKAIEEVRPAR